MHLAPLLALLLTTGPARADGDARAVAQEVLNKGSALFDAHDATLMANTYAEDAKIFWVERAPEASRLKVVVKDGRQEIEALYRDLFKDPDDRGTSRNTVDYAHFVADDVLLIAGTFEPDIAKEGKYAFVQERVKSGDRWLIQSLRIYVVSKP